MYNIPYVISERYEQLIDKFEIVQPNLLAHTVFSIIYILLGVCIYHDSCKHEFKYGYHIIILYNLKQYLCLKVFIVRKNCLQSQSHSLIFNNVLKKKNKPTSSNVIEVAGFILKHALP